MFIGKNINHLRQVLKFTLHDLSERIGIGVATISAYENDRTKPSFDVLLKLGQVLQVSIDDLIYRDLSNEKIDDLTTDYVINMKGISGSNILVPYTAQAGYSILYDESTDLDATYVQIPGITGEARTFEVAGDSMFPVIGAGDWVSGNRLEKINHGEIQVIVTRDEGIHIKYAQDFPLKILCISANSAYNPYWIEKENIIEIWEAKVKITQDFSDPRLLAPDYKKLDKIEKFLRKNFPDYDNNIS